MSTNSTFERVAQLFAAACELPRSEWRAFLELECESDTELIAEVLDLLSQDADSSGPILKDPQAARPQDSGSAEFLDQLSRHKQRESRYRIEGELARGGMGAILKVWDEDVGRQLAMKVILGQEEPTGESPKIPDRALNRFLEEAQITGQLDHPGIVPVHELGLDDEGRVYFTMQLVRGRDLREIFKLAEADEEEWTQTRALGVLLKVCEAMTYAHSKGVIHRDLKPANIMVGRFGEVYVMDWGLGRVLGSKESKDVRLAGPPPQESEGVRTFREDSDHRPDSPLYTLDGDVVGTPAYMSPEQARGDIERVNHLSDVYSIGAVLYELLSGRMPYAPSEGRPSPRAVWRWVLDGPPQPIAQIRTAAPELVAICDRAMHRESSRRYSDMGALARDLRAWLEGRVVTAHRTGILIEVRKWVARNRATSAISVILVSTLLAFGVEVGRQQSVRAEASQLIADADLSAALVESARYASHSDAQTWIEQAQSLVARTRSARLELTELRNQEQSRGRATVEYSPESHEDYSRWVLLKNHRTGFELAIDLARAALEQDPEDPVSQRELDYLPAVIQDLDVQIQLLGERLERHEQWIFADKGRGARNESLTALTNNIWELERSGGLIELVSRNLKRTSKLILGAQKDWEQAIAEIRNDDRYGGLVLEPQSDLVPIGPNVQSGLWEFLHVPSGDMPALSEATGELLMRPESGIVLVLIPGGQAKLGVQKTEPNSPRYFASALDNECPVSEIPLDPYFISKYEMTQAQWIRATGSNPSERKMHMSADKKKRISPTHPVELIDWNEARLVLRRWGLTIPSIAQSEHASRGMQDGVFWSISDADYPLFINSQVAADGFTLHAPVDSLRPNAFGLYHTTGNVWEWCRDWNYSSDIVVEFGEGDGLLETELGPYPDIHFLKIRRGGGWKTTDRDRLRFSFRERLSPGARDDDLGVRPARAVKGNQ